MNEEFMEFDSYLEFYKSNNIVEQKPKPHGSRQDNFIDSPGDFESPGDLSEEQEPLFVEDRTNNFRLRYAIQYENPVSNQSKKNQMRPRQNSCWNCSSTNHSLHDCPEHRNHRLINQNRQMFLMQKQQQQHFGNKSARNKYGGQSNMRYFVGNNNSPFSNFTPGKMSDELMEALGLPKDGIPAHVYNMREHGYPGGWLDDARKEYSGISIFTAPNECIPLPGKENVENDMYYYNIDEKKLHEYPGFNAPNPPDVLDEYKKYGCPEYNPEQNLKNMIEILKLNKVDTKLTKGDSCHKDDDMGFASNSNETLKREDDMLCKVVEEGKPPSSPEDGEITDDDDDAITKDKDCLNKNNVKSPSSDTVLEESINEQSISDSFVSCIDTKELEDSTQSSVPDSTISQSLELSAQSSSKRKFGDVKTEVLGTPVLKRFSTYENRPTHEHFAKGMVDMVDHENLPNSVGTFKKIKEILKDVRKTLNNLL